MTMSFSQGAAATGIYYQFAIAMITVVDYVLVKFALPAIHIYFLLCIANQLSKQDLFSKMAELIRDVVKFVIKTMFGVMMGIHVIQGMILPLTAQMENSALVKLTSAIPGVGNTISSVTSTVLCAGTLVKNSVGAAGVIVVALYCGVPLLRLVISRFLFQLTNALIQPISDRRVTACIGAVEEALRLLAYAVFVGCLLFVVSIALMSTMTS
jgi:stage III sporulation protein AE